MSPPIQPYEHPEPMDLQGSLNAWLPPGVHALCTTREGGVSRAPFESLNLGDHVHDHPDQVAENRLLFTDRLGGAVPVFLNQVHGTQVVALTADTPQGVTADASVTTDSEVACTILVADCLPLLLSDATGRLVAAAHAGWRGLAAGVIEHTVDAMKNACKEVQTHAIHAWLGPCIGPDAFEVGPEVRAAFMAQQVQAGAYFQTHPSRPNKWLADLAGLARLRLQALGVQTVSGNDSTKPWCTVTQNAQFFSYRRDGVTGRFAACIWRRP
jgi:hypothetical protein